MLRLNQMMCTTHEGLAIRVGGVEAHMVEVVDATTNNITPKLRGQFVSVITVVLQVIYLIIVQLQRRKEEPQGIASVLNVAILLIWLIHVPRKEQTLYTSHYFKLEKRWVNSWEKL